MTTERYTDISKEHVDLAFSFIETLKLNDVEKFWSLVSKVDQSRIYGMYRAGIANTLSTLSFKEYIKTHIFPDVRAMYEKVLEEPGVATHLRYSEFGEDQVYILENVKVPRHYIAPSEERVFPVTIIIDTELNNGEISSDFKVRLYIDKDYMNI